jgi:hypothetical protein
MRFGLARFRSRSRDLAGRGHRQFVDELDARANSPRTIVGTMADR